MPTVELHEPPKAVQATQQPFLDFLRTIAALLVLFSHTRNWYFAPIASAEHPTIALRLFWFLTVLGDEAVVLFFVLSGFLVGGGAHAAMRRGSFRLADYLIARFARVYIVFVPAMLLSAIVFWIGTSIFTDPVSTAQRPLFSEQQWPFSSFGTLACHVLDLQGFACKAWRQNPPIWSLGYEWALYLFAPAALLLLTLRVNWAIRSAAISTLLALALYISVQPATCAFWFGVWFSGVYGRHLHRTGKVPLWAALLGVMIAVASMAVSRLRPDFATAAHAALALGTVLALACPRLLDLRLAPRFFKWSADFSFSLYLTHVPVIYFMVSALQALGLPAVRLPPGLLPFEAFAVTVAVCLAVAYVFSLVTERRTAEFRQFLSRAPRLPRVGVPSS